MKRLFPILIGSVLFICTSATCEYLATGPGRGGGGGQGSGGGGGGGNASTEGYIGANFPDQRFLEFAQKEGIRVERHDYAPDELNSKGDPCRRFADLYYPTGTPKGIFLLFHGGGFDVGYADHKNMAIKAKGLTERGYIAASVEYRRGWTNAQFSGSDRDVFNSSPAEYARLETAARMAIEDARLAVEYIRNEVGKTLPVYAEGTSAGGSLVLYLALIDKQWREANKFSGGICGYGGISIDEVPSIVAPDFPLLMAGGIHDTRVPFYEGWYFEANNKSEQGIGMGEIYNRLAPLDAPVCLIATCNAGHVYGALNDDEIFDLFFDLLDDFENGKDDLPQRTNYIMSHQGGADQVVSDCD